jgi:hypothetical protein
MSEITEFTFLLCGRTVPTSLYKSVRDRVLERASELELGIPYTLKMICGEQYWNGLHSYKTYAGLVMADLVDQQLVPYFFASERDAKPLWYRLKP